MTDIKRERKKLENLCVIAIFREIKRRRGREQNRKRVREKEREAKREEKVIVCMCV